LSRSSIFSQYSDICNCKPSHWLLYHSPKEDQHQINIFYKFCTLAPSSTKKYNLVTQKSYLAHPDFTWSLRLLDNWSPINKTLNYALISTTMFTAFWFFFFLSNDQSSSNHTYCTHWNSSFDLCSDSQDDFSLSTLKNMHKI
jgi:hypothetical protein